MHALHGHYDVATNEPSHVPPSHLLLLDQTLSIFGASLHFSISILLTKKERNIEREETTYGYYGDETQISVFHCRGCHQEMFTVISLSTLIAIF